MRSKLMLLAVLIAVNISPLRVSAQDADLSPAKEKKWQIGFGSMMLKHEYEEPGLMKESGYSAIGLSTFLRYTGDEVMFALRYESSFMQVDYEGGVQRVEDGVVTIEPVTVPDIEDKFDDLRFIGGRRIRVNPRTDVIPYLGIAARFWSDELSKFEYGYRRKSKYYYSPVGIEFEFRSRQDSVKRYGFSLEYDLFYSGQQLSYLSDMNVEYSALFGESGLTLGDAENEQDDGYGYRFTGHLENRLNGDIIFYLEAFVRYWSISASKIDMVNYRVEEFQAYNLPPLVEEGYLPVIEPKNETLQFGISMMFSTRF